MNELTDEQHELALNALSALLRGEPLEARRMLLPLPHGALRAVWEAFETGVAVIGGVMAGSVFRDLMVRDK